jgi:hypothetical protein
MLALLIVIAAIAVLAFALVLGGGFGSYERRTAFRRVVYRRVPVRRIYTTDRPYPDEAPVERPVYRR